MTPGPDPATPPDDQTKEDFMNEVRDYLTNNPPAAYTQVASQHLHDGVARRMDQATLNDGVARGADLTPTLHDGVARPGDLTTGFRVQADAAHAPAQPPAANAATGDAAVVDFIMRHEGASGVQGGIPEVYGFRQSDHDGYDEIVAARTQYGQGSPEEIAVVTRFMEAHAHRAGADQFTDPGVRAAVMSLAHMRGVGGAHAILNAMAANSPTPHYSASALDAGAARTLNGLTPREFQQRLRDTRWQYDEEHYGTPNVPRGSHPHYDSHWDRYRQGLSNRYNDEQQEFLNLSPNPDVASNPSQ